MLHLVLSLAALSSVALAQTTSTVSLLLPQADPQSLVGSIVGGDATATTYVIQCANGGKLGRRQAAATTVGASPTGDGSAQTSAGPSPPGDVAAQTTGSSESSDDSCGFPSPITVVQGPSTLHYTYAVSAGSEVAGASLECKLSGTTKAVCEGAAVEESNTASFTSATLTGSDLPPFLPVAITAGFSNVKGAAVTPTSTGATSMATASGKSTATSSGKTGSTSSTKGTSTGTATGTAGQSAKNAAVGEREAGKLGLAMAGVLAVGAAAIML